MKHDTRRTRSPRSGARSLRTLLGSALIAGAAVTLPVVVGTASPAHAGDCSLGYVLCGRVSNGTNNRITIHGNQGWGTLQPGEVSFFGIMRDVDEFSFPDTGFYVYNSHFDRGQLYRIHDGMHAVCAKQWPFEPRCGIFISA